jgi:hypothetical protein
MKWLRTLAGLGLGVMNLFANGVTPKQLGVSALMAALGAVTHYTSVDPQ